MTEAVESRARRAPFLWVSSAAFHTLLHDLPERQRASVGWVYLCMASAASDYRDGDHDGFASTASEVQALTGMSRPTFRNAVMELERLGLLLRETRTNEQGAPVGVRYVLLEPEQSRGGKKLTYRQETRQTSYPANAHTRNGSEEVNKTPITPLAKEQAIRAGSERLVYNRKTATKTQTKIAVDLFDAWQSETGEKTKMFNGLGKPSPAIRQIVGAVMAYPDVEGSYWMRMLHTVLASPFPYWGTSPSIGVVFGEKVVEANLADPTRNAGKPPLNTPNVVTPTTAEERAEGLAAYQRRVSELDTG